MIPLKYIIQHLLKRKKRTLFTVLGIALTIAVYAAMSAVTQTMIQSFQTTGLPKEVFILEGSALSADFSNISRETLTYIQTLDEVLYQDNQPLVSPELYLGTVIEVSGIRAEVQVRGVTPIVADVYQQITLKKGGWPQIGKKIAVGAALAGRFGIRPGDTITFQNESWEVGGIFESRGRVYDREVWVELDELAAVADRPAYSNYMVRTADAAAAARLIETVNKNRRYALKAMSSADFYRRGGGMAIYMAKKGVFLAYVIAIGSVFAAMNTMYAAVAMRRKEIAILKAIGYRPLKILTALAGESVFMGFMGGILGLVIASALSLVPVDLPSLPAGYVNIHGRQIVSAMLMSMAVGLLGGLLPAIQAAGTRVVNAFR